MEGIIRFKQQISDWAHVVVYVKGVMDMDRLLLSDLNKSKHSPKQQTNLP